MIVTIFQEISTEDMERLLAGTNCKIRLKLIHVSSTSKEKEILRQTTIKFL